VTVTLTVLSEKAPLGIKLTEIPYLRKRNKVMGKLLPYLGVSLTFDKKSAQWSVCDECRTYG
jgi:hypothetical protein